MATVKGKDYICKKHGKIIPILTSNIIGNLDIFCPYCVIDILKNAINFAGLNKIQIKEIEYEVPDVPEQSNTQSKQNIEK
jgi:hypothetical protein